MDYFPDNTLNAFKIKLPEPIRFENVAMEVGLAEIHYSHTWLNIKSTDDGSLTDRNVFYFNDGIGYRGCFITEGHYDSVSQLIDEMNRALTSTTVGNKEHIHFSYNVLNRKVTVHIDKPDIKVYFVNPICNMLGFKDGSEITQTTTAPNVSDVDRITSFYVYANIVEAQIVGNSSVPMLRTVPVQGQVGDYVAKIYDQPHYLPVSVKQFDVVEINIMDELGKPVPFESGRVVVKLHFRPSRQLYV